MKRERFVPEAAPRALIMTKVLLIEREEILSPQQLFLFPFLWFAAFTRWNIVFPCELFENHKRIWHNVNFYNVTILYCVCLVFVNLLCKVTFCQRCTRYIRAMKWFSICKNRNSTADKITLLSLKQFSRLHEHPPLVLACSTYLWMSPFKTKNSKNITSRRESRLWFIK